MSFRGRPIESHSDVEWLVDTRVQESVDIEYKSQLYGPDDSSRREMLRDIASMANASGGLILVGIEEDGEGLPLQATGVEPGNHAERIVDSLVKTRFEEVPAL